MSYTRTVFESGVGDIGVRGAIGGRTIATAIAARKGTPVVKEPTRFGTVVATKAPQTYPDIPTGAPHREVWTLAGKKWMPCAWNAPGAKCLVVTPKGRVWSKCRPPSVSIPSPRLGGGRKPIPMPVRPTKGAPIVVHPAGSSGSPVTGNAGGTGGGAESYAPGGGVASPPVDAWGAAVSYGEGDAPGLPEPPPGAAAEPVAPPAKKPMSTIAKVGIVAGAGVALFTMFAAK